MKNTLHALLVVAATLLGTSPVLAQETSSFDMSSFNQTTGTSAQVDPLQSASQINQSAEATTEITDMHNTPYQQSVDINGTLTSDPQYVPGTYTNQNGNGTNRVTTVVGNTTAPTGTQSMNLFSASQSLLSPGTFFGNTQIPTGDSLGFPAESAKIYKGVCGTQYGGILMPTSTAEVTLSITNGW